MSIQPYQHRKSTTVTSGAAAKPTTLLLGELAVNYATGYESIFLKNASGTIVCLNDWSQILSKPTTLSGYGITDFKRSSVDWDEIFSDSYVGFFSGLTNSPISGGSSVMGISVPLNTSANYGMQLAGRNDVLYFRTKEAAVNTSWRSIFHSGNSNLATVDWNAKNLILAGTLTGVTTGQFSSEVSVGLTLSLLNRGDFVMSASNTITTSTGYRWIFRIGTTTESGSNVGSDLEFIRRSDTGVSLGSALTLKRSTGDATFVSTVTATSLVLAGSITGATTGAFSSTINSANYQIGKQLLAAPTTFQTTMFGSNNSGFRMKVYRHDYANDIFGQNNCTGIAVSAYDTHFFMNFTYSAASGGIFVGAGYGDAITWNAKLLLDSTHVLPSINNSYAIGNGSYQWSNIYSVLGTFSSVLTASDISLPHSNAWGYIKNPSASGGLKLGTGNSSGVYADALSISVAGNYVRSEIPLIANTNLTVTNYSYLRGNVLIGVNKTAWNDGLPGIMLEAAGSIRINASTPFINFNYNNSTADFTSRLIEYGSGLLTIMNSQGLYIGSSYKTTQSEKLYVDGATTVNGNLLSNSLQIGSAKLLYDATSNSIYVQKADGTAVNFYATGFVSAYGIGSSGVDNLTVLSGVSTYTVLLTDSFIGVDGSINITITLPPTAPFGFTLKIKRSGSATVTIYSADYIAKTSSTYASSYTIPTQGDTIELVKTSSAWTWGRYSI